MGIKKKILHSGMISFLFIMPLFSEEPIFIFVHGIFNSSLQARPYQKVLKTLGYHTFIVFNFTSSFYFPFLHRIHKPLTSSLGQESEIEQLNTIYENIIYSHIHQNKSVPPIIIIGISLGAAIVLNFLGTKKPKYVCAAICESSFDTTRTIVETRFSGNNTLIGSHFYQLFKNHNPEGMQPIKSVKQIPYHISLLLFASETDKSIPATATERLHQKLLTSGHKNVSFIVFKKGRHARLFRYNKKEYTAAVKIFLSQVLGEKQV